MWKIYRIMEVLQKIMKKQVFKRTLLVLCILSIVSVLNFLLVFTVCWVKGYGNLVAYSNGLFYLSFVYMILAVYMMMINGTSFHNVRNYKVPGRLSTNSFHLTDKNFGVEASESIYSMFTAFRWWAMLFAIGLITFGLSTIV